MSTFDAGAIEATLTLDRFPFGRDLKAAREQARRFTKTPIKVPIKADRTGLTRELKNARAQLRRFTARDYSVNVNADTAAASASLSKLAAKADRIERDDVTINADADTGAATAKLGLLQSQMLASRGGAGLLTASLLAIAPMAVPAIAATSGAVLGLSGALAGAAGGAAVLAAGIIGNYQKVSKYTDLVTKAQEKLAAATNPADRKKAAEELAQAQQKVAHLSGPMGQAAHAILGVKSAWSDFLKGVQKPAFGIITQGLNIVKGVLPRLTPLFKTFARVASDALGSLGKWTKSSSFQSFLDFINKTGATAFRHLVDIMGNLAQTVGPLLKAFAPIGNQILGWLSDVTAGWARWAKNLDRNQGFQNFLGYVQRVGPKVADMFGQLVRAIGNIAKSLAPLAGPVLTALTSVFKFIGKMDPSLLGAIATGIISIAVAFKLVNAVMGLLSANPLTLIIAGVVGLAAALVYAYKHSETFRNIVNGAFKFVQKVVTAVADWFMGHIWPTMSKVLTWIGNAAVWLWKNAIRPAMGFIWDMAKRVFGWFQSTGWPIIKKVFGWIGNVVSWLWKNIIKPYFGAWWKIAKSVFGWLKNTGWPIVKRVFNWIGGKAGWLWHKVIKPTFGWIKGAWEWISDGGRAAWGWIKKIVKWIGDKIGTLKGVFQDVVGWIVDHFINPLQRLLNKLGVSFQLPGNTVGAARATIGSTGRNGDQMYASGGVLPGYTPGRDVHRFYSPTGGSLALSGGEAIMRPEFTRAVGGAAGVARLNAAARHGAAFAGGGIWDAVKSAVNIARGAGSSADVANVGLTASQMINKVKNLGASLLSNMPGGMWFQAAASVARKMLSAVVSKVKDWVFGGGGSGKFQGGWRQLWQLVQSFHTGASLTSAFRPGARTATGFISGHALGQAIDVSPVKALWDRLWPMRNRFRELYGPWGGWLLGKSRWAYPGAAQTLANHKDHIHIRAFALGGVIRNLQDLANSGLVNNAGTFDNGGTLAPGWNLVNNQTGGHEGLARTDDLAAVFTEGLRQTNQRLDAVLEQLQKRQHVKMTIGGQEFDAYIEGTAYRGISNRVHTGILAGRKGL